MANPPIIVNRQPGEGAVNVKAVSPVRFGLRDLDTRVELSSVYTSITYGRLVYRPDALPLVDETLGQEEFTRAFSIFNDAAGAVLPQDPADQTVEDLPPKVYRIERTLAAPQEGFLYVSDEYTGSRPYAAEVTLDLAVTSTTAYSYVTYPDFTGVMFGLVYWPRNTGVFLFFRDTGAVKGITIAGPSADGAGTRPVETTVLFDWSADTYTYKIYWDEVSYRRKVFVFAVDSSGNETVLADFLATDFNEFLPTVVLGRHSAEDPPSRIEAVIGTDGSTPGDYIDIYKLDLFRFGIALVSAGGPSGSSEVDITPTETLLVSEEEDLEEWVREGTGEVVDLGNLLSMQRDESLAAADTFQFFREEPELAKGEWMVIGAVVGSASVHTGTFNTGMGVDVEDGTTHHVFRLLDDFVDKDVGILDSGPIGLLESHFRPAEPFDWSELFQFIILGSSTKDLVRLFLDDDTNHAVETDTYARPLSSSETRISVCFVDNDFEYYGAFNLSYLWLFTNCRFYEPGDGTYPPPQGWARTSSGGSRSLTADGHLLLENNEVGAYDIYYLVVADYVEESGTALYMKAQVTDWVDTSGAENPPRKEIGPIAFLRSEGGGVQLHMVESETGRRYVYLAHENDDVADVLAQNEEGRLLSAEVDFTEMHSYILVMKPRQYIRLYVDYSPIPVIDVPWSSKGLAFRAFPPTIPALTTIAFGSLHEDRGVKVEIAFARASVGTGYDFVISPSLTDDELNDHVYGSEAEVLIDFEDVDP